MFIDHFDSKNAYASLMLSLLYLSVRYDIPVDGAQRVRRSQLATNRSGKGIVISAIGETIFLFLFVFFVQTGSSTLLESNEDSMPTRIGRFC